MSDFFKVLGPVCWAIGGWLLYWGLSMGVTVNPDGSGEIANLQLMHVQQLNILLGALTIIHGTVCLIGGLILDRKSGAA